MADTEVLDILLVEDNESHAELVIDCLTENHLARTIYHAGDGREALDYLFHQGRYCEVSSSPRPQVILLDLRLPKVDGLDVLKAVKGDAELHSIPVVVLSSSSNSNDVDAAYRLNANSYLTKPVSFQDFSSLLSSFGDYWLNRNHVSQT